MASFYACYIFTIVFTLGIYFRIRLRKNVNLIVLVISGMLSFALGIQSLRGTLVLYLPLIVFAIIMMILRKNEKSSTVYVVALCIANVAGIIVIKCIPVKSAPIISELSLTLNVADLINNLQLTTSELLSITGLKFCTQGIKWIPLFVVSVFFCVVIALAMVKIIKNRHKTKESMIEGSIIFFIISLIAVFFVGIFMFRVRAIYFFVWYLLVVFSFIYVVGEYEKISKVVSVILCFAGVLNYIMNFCPDFFQYTGRNNFYQEVADELIAEGIDCLYYELHTSPLLAVFSDDQIVSGTVHLDPEEQSGGVMYPVNYLEPLDIFKNSEQYNAYIVFSNWTFDYLERSTSDVYIEKLMSNLEYVRKVSYQDEELTFYRFSSDLLNYSE